jgi:RNA polymerase sigma factor (sigma-70 family)
MNPPPPAEGLASRLFLVPALRTQPDRRLVTLVRDGYDTAFEEIVRRYGKALTRYAAAIVGGRSEDVTQDAFSKALLALRRDSEAEIDLKPWLYRIVRNTALNDLRDRPPDGAELTEGLGGGSRSAAEEAERREEIAELMQRLRDLPEPQRAAIVMRELEGLGHDEIASALGLSGGGARQTIYRARRALRDGLGLAIPLPVLRMLIEHGGPELSAGAAAAAAMGGAGASAGAGTALKVGVLTAVLAGSVGTGLAIKENSVHDRDAEAAAAATVPGATGAQTRSVNSTSTEGSATEAGSRSGSDEADGEESGGSDGSDGELGESEDPSGKGSGEGPSREPEPGEDRGSSRSGPGPDGSGADDGGHSGPGPSLDVSGHGGPGSGGGGPGPSGGDSGSSGSGSSGSGSSGSGSSGSGSSGSGSSGSGSSGSGSSGSGSGGGPGPSGGTYIPPPLPPEGDSSGPGSGGSGSSGSGGSGSSGSGSGVSGSGTDGLLD